MAGRVSVSAVLEHKRAPYDVKVDSSIMLAIHNGVSAAPAGIDVVFVLDTSSSMSGEPVRRVRDVYSFLLEKRLREGVDRVALITFDNVTTQHYPLTSDGNTWRQGANKIVSRIGTRMGPALDLATQLVGQSSSPERRPVIAVMTDGITFNREQVRADWPKQLAVAAHCRPTVLTLGFTNHHDQPLLQRLVDQAPSGAFLAVPGLDQIVESLECFFADHMRPVTLAAAQLKVQTTAAIIGDPRVGKGETFSRASQQEITITVNGAEEDRQRHFIVPISLPPLEQPAAKAHVATVTVTLTLADGTTATQTFPPLCLARDAASSAQPADARTADDVNLGVVGEKARIITASALLSAYTSVRVKDPAGAVDAIRSGQSRLDANSVRTATGEPVHTVATMVHREHLERGKVAVDRFATVAAKCREGKEGGEFMVVHTATLSLLADIGRAELNERPSALVPQYVHKSVDEQRAQAREAGLTSAAIEPDSASETQALPEVLTAASTVDAERVRFTDVGHFERNARGGVLSGLADLLEKRQARLADPNSGKELEERIQRNKAAREAEQVAQQQAALAQQRRTFKRPQKDGAEPSADSDAAARGEGEVAGELAAILAKRRKLADVDEPPAES